MKEKPYRGAGDFCDRCLAKIEDFYWFNPIMTLRIVQGSRNDAVGWCLCMECTKDLEKFMDELHDKVHGNEERETNEPFRGLVEVVRCKECELLWMCSVKPAFTEEQKTHYCAWGRRKKNGDQNAE